MILPTPARLILPVGEVPCACQTSVPARVSAELLALLDEFAGVGKTPITVIKLWNKDDVDPYHCAGIAADIRFEGGQLPIGVQFELLSSYRALGGIGLVKRLPGSLFEWHVDLRSGARCQYWTKIGRKVSNGLGSISAYAWRFV